MTRVLLAGVLALLALAGQASAETARCEPPNPSVGVATPIPAMLSEAQKVAISTVIFETLRAPAQGARPETQLGSAPCPIATFAAGQHTYTLHGGDPAVTPLWAASPSFPVTFYLARGKQTAEAVSLGLKGRPYILAAMVDHGAERLRHVVAVFDGMPSIQMMEDAIRQRVTTSGNGPLGVYDSEGDAVTLFRGVEHDLNAQLFGPPPTGQRTAAILLADGRYFAPGQDTDVVMRAAGIPCPGVLGALDSRQLIVVEGDPARLDLACQYASDHVRLSVFVERLPKADLAVFFEHQRAEMKKDFKKVEDTPQLVGVKGSTRFEYGASWLGSGDHAGGIWVGRKGEYVIELDASWDLASYQEARQAVRTFDQSVFGP